MKKLQSIFFVMILFVCASRAQQASEIYKMKSGKDAEIILKVLTNELKFSQGESDEVRNILYGSMKDEAQLFVNEKSLNNEDIQIAVTRQTEHIEGNLQNIIGEKRFAIYLEKKSAIAKQIYELENH